MLEAWEVVKRVPNSFLGSHRRLIGGRDGFTESQRMSNSWPDIEMCVCVCVCVCVSMCVYVCDGIVLTKYYCIVDMIVLTKVRESKVNAWKCRGHRHG